MTEPANDTDAIPFRTDQPGWIYVIQGELTGLLLEALVQAKKALWLDARSQWTMADFKAWPVVQQIDAALTKATGVAR